jgi:hypothetical protein
MRAVPEGKRFFGKIQNHAIKPYKVAELSRNYKLTVHKGNVKVKADPVLPFN